MRTIVIVDDHQIMLSGMKALLSKYFRVITASTTAGALALIRDHKPDLVLSDINRPESGGFDLLEQIRRDRDTIGIPFVFVTMMDRDKHEIRALQAGADGFISKGENVNYLVEKISALMSRADVYRNHGSIQAPLRTLRVFVSYAREDERIAREIWTALRRLGVNAWIDIENILPGQEWELEIRKGIRGADAMVLCLSSNSVSKRGYVQKELKLALDMADALPEGDVFLIPIKLNDCEVPHSLSKWNWIDQSARDFWPKVVATLTRVAEKRAILPPNEKNAGTSSNQDTDRKGK